MSERMTDEAFHAEIDELDKQGRYALAMLRATREADRARASETAHAAEIERLTADLREAKVQLDAAEATCEDEEAAHAETLILLEEAKAEVARLTPSGQVADDEKIVSGEWPATKEARAAALSRLAAQAHGYEVMKVERDAAVAESSTHLEWMKEERTRAEQAEKERDAALACAEAAEKQARLAWERHAEKDKAYGGIIAQRDAVEAAVVETVGGKVEGAPVSRINYLQRLRELVIIEQAFVALSRLRAGDAAEQARQSETIKALEGALTTIAERGVSSTDRRIARNALLLTRWLP